MIIHEEISSTELPHKIFDPAEGLEELECLGQFALVVRAEPC